MAVNFVDQTRYCTATVGMFYSKIHAICICKKYCFRLKFNAIYIQLLALLKYVLHNIRSGYRAHVNNIQFIFLLITIILLCNYIADNPGPEHSLGLTIFHLKCRSVRNKLDDILHYIESCDIICIPTYIFIKLCW